MFMMMFMMSNIPQSVRCYFMLPKIIEPLYFFLSMKVYCEQALEVSGLLLVGPSY